MNTTRIIPVLAALVCSVGSRSTAAAAHEDTHTHASLSAGALTFLDNDFYTGARRELIIQASVAEDACPNYLSHFYNPKTGADGGIYVAPCDLFPTVTTALQRATTLYDEARTSYASGDTDQAFRQLGSVMHLLQDMTSPAHVHGDPHLQIIGGQCANDGDDFEKWGWCEAKGTTHIFDYAFTSGEITPRMQYSLDMLFAAQPQYPPDGSHATNFVHHVANLVYDFTSYPVALVDDLFGDDPQPDSEFKRMFPTLREAPGPGFYVDGLPDQTIGFTNGTCGGCGFDEWWLMETSCADDGNCISAPYHAVGLAYIENTGGEPGGDGGLYLEDLLVPRVYEKPMFVDLYGTMLNAGVPSGFGDPRSHKTMLRIYGDVLYACAIAYGAGLLEAFYDDVAPAPIAAAGGPYDGESGTTVTFDAGASTDENGTILEYAWDFDDDGVVDATGATPLMDHIYPAAYMGMAVLTVTDNDGRTDRDTAEVHVVQSAMTNAPPASGGGGCSGTVGNGLDSGGDPSLLVLLAGTFLLLVARRRRVALG